MNTDESNTVDFTRLINTVMPTLPPTAWKLLCFILCQIQEGTTKLTYKDIREGTSIASDTTIKNYLDLLIERGLIDPEQGPWNAKTYSSKFTPKTVVKHSARITTDSVVKSGFTTENGEQFTTESVGKNKFTTVFGVPTKEVVNNNININLNDDEVKLNINTIPRARENPSVPQSPEQIVVVVPSDEKQKDPRSLIPNGFWQREPIAHYAEEYPHEEWSPHDKEWSALVKFSTDATDREARQRTFDHWKRRRYHGKNIAGMLGHYHKELAALQKGQESPPTDPYKEIKAKKDALYDELMRTDDRDRRRAINDEMAGLVRRLTQLDLQQMKPMRGAA